MTLINLLTKILIILVVIIISAVSRCSTAISDKRLCYDSTCSEPIALARTVSKYYSNDPGVLSFPVNTEVKIFSKPAGKRPDLLGAEIKGKRGYVPIKLVQEYKVLKKNVTYEVPTEEAFKEVDVKKSKETEESHETIVQSEKNVPSNSSGSSDGGTETVVIDSSDINTKETVPNPEDVSPSYDVIDGTTIHYSAQELSTKEPYVDNIVENVPTTEQPVLSILPSIVPSSAAFVSQLSRKRNEASGESYLKIQQEAIREESNASQEKKPTTASVDDVNIQDDGVVSKSSFEVTKEVEKEVEDSENESKNENNSESEKFDVNSLNATDDLENREESRDTEKAADGVEDQDNTDNAEFAADIERLGHSPEHQGEVKDIRHAQSSESAPADVTNTSQNVPEAETRLLDPVVALKYADKNLSNDSEKISNDFNNNDVLEQEKIEQGLPSGQLLDTEISNKKETEISDNVPIEVEPVAGESNDAALKSVKDPSTPLNNIQDEQSEKTETVRNNNTFKEPLNEQSLPNVVTDGNAEVKHEEYLSEVPVSKNQVIQESAPSQLALENSVFNGTVKVDEKYDQLMQESDSSKLASENSTFDDIATVTEVHDPLANEADDQIIGEENSFDSSIAKENTATAFVELPHYENSQPDSASDPESSPNNEQESSTLEATANVHEFPTNRNLLNVEEGKLYDNYEPDMGKEVTIDVDQSDVNTLPEYGNNISDEEKVLTDRLSVNELPFPTDHIAKSNVALEKQGLPSEVCQAEGDCESSKEYYTSAFLHQDEEETHDNGENAIMSTIRFGRNYWEMLSYLCLTAFTILIFSLGSYYIENARRDVQLIARINKLEKELLVSTKECGMLEDELKSTKSKLTSIEDQSFGSNEMVASLKVDLEASLNARTELEDQIATLERDLESATEAGLELERMLREFLSSNNEDNPLAQSVDDLQRRLNAQQANNESLTNTLNVKVQEYEALSSEMATLKDKCQKLESGFSRLTEELTVEKNLKNRIEQTLNDRVRRLETQVQEVSAEKTSLRSQLKSKEIEIKDLLEVVSQIKSNKLDLDKFYEVSHIKANAADLLEERDELKVKLSEVEGAHQLLEEHMKLIQEEMVSLSEQCKLAEKERKDAETRLEVLSNFFKEKEAQRQKEEAVWLEKQGEVSSTVERLQTMQNEIHNYKQQIEILKREILEQEREYKGQISALETKSHEQWVIARQCERRLEESKAEASQLRNRLTLTEKNMNDVDADSKLHRLETNGETTASPPLYLGPESSNSPIMFTSGVPPPPPPPYVYGPPLPPFLPPPMHPSSGMPPYDFCQRLPPLGGRLSSPPPLPQSPLHHQTSGRYDNSNSPPPPLSPPLPPPYGHHRSPPPPPFSNDRIHPPPPPSLLPLPMDAPWGNELPPRRGTGFHPHQRELHARNHKDSLHSSGDSLDRTHHSGKV